MKPTWFTSWHVCKTIFNISHYTHQHQGKYWTKVNRSRPSQIRKVGQTLVSGYCVLATARKQKNIYCNKIEIRLYMKFVTNYNSSSWNQHHSNWRHYFLHETKNPIWHCSLIIISPPSETGTTTGIRNRFLIITLSNVNR